MERKLQGDSPALSAPVLRTGTEIVKFQGTRYKYVGEEEITNVKMSYKLRRRLPFLNSLERHSSNSKKQLLKGGI